MEIKFVKRQYIVNQLLDRMNKGESLNDELKVMLTDFINNKNDIQNDENIQKNKS